MIGPYGNVVNNNSFGNSAYTEGMFSSDDSNIFDSTNKNNFNNKNVIIPELEPDNTPLSSDIPDYKKEKKKVDPFIWIETNEDVNAEGIIDELTSLLP